MRAGLQTSQSKGCLNTVQKTVCQPAQPEPTENPLDLHHSVLPAVAKSLRNKPLANTPCSAGLTPGPSVEIQGAVEAHDLDGGRAEATLHVLRRNRERIARKFRENRVGVCMGVTFWDFVPFHGCEFLGVGTLFTLLQEQTKSKTTIYGVPTFDTTEPQTKLRRLLRGGTRSLGRATCLTLEWGY